MPSRYCDGAVVVGAGRFLAHGGPVGDGVIVAPEPGDGDQFDLLVLRHRVDERVQFLCDGVVAIVLQHLDVLVVGRIGGGVGLDGIFLGVEFACLDDDETDLVRRDRQVDVAIDRSPVVRLSHHVTRNPAPLTQRDKFAAGEFVPFEKLFDDLKAMSAAPIVRATGKPSSYADGGGVKLPRLDGNSCGVIDALLLRSRCPPTE